MHAQALVALLSLVGARAACVPPESFTAIDFSNSAVVRSNLGGQGGECDTPGACEEQGYTAATPHEIYIRNILNVGGVSVDLRITNESEYKTVQPQVNGLTANGELVEINLLAPREGGPWGRDFTGYALARPDPCQVDPILLLPFSDRILTTNVLHLMDLLLPCFLASLLPCFLASLLRQCAPEILLRQ